MPFNIYFSNYRDILDDFNTGEYISMEIESKTYYAMIVDFIEEDSSKIMVIYPYHKTNEHGFKQLGFYTRDAVIASNVKKIT